ncbi:MAG: hypothetical protein V4787_27050 [Pseudomonadota bacterium]
MSILRKLAALAVLLACSAAHAQISPTSTYAGLTWGFSTGNTQGLTTCSTLVLDATGDFTYGESYLMSGRLYCPSAGGSYASSGVAYFDAAGLFHMTVSLSVSYQMVCDNLSNFGGTCPIYNNQGSPVGSAVIAFL